MKTKLTKEELTKKEQKELIGGLFISDSVDITTDHSKKNLNRTCGCGCTFPNNGHIYTNINKAQGCSCDCN